MKKNTEQFNIRIPTKTRAKLEVLGNSGDSHTCPLCKQRWNKKELHLEDSQKMLPTALAAKIIEKAVDELYRRKFDHD